MLDGMNVATHSELSYYVDSPEATASGLPKEQEVRLGNSDASANRFWPVALEKKPRAASRPGGITSGLPGPV